MNDTLTTEVRKLADARRKMVAFKDELAEVQALFTEKHAALIANLKTAATDVATTEATVRTLALAAYKTTKEKKPVAGVEIKEGVVLVYDAKEALAWAKKSETAIVPESLNIAVFESVAPKLDLPFVTITKEPKATIAKDLDKAFQDAEAAAPAPIPEPEPTTEPALAATSDDCPF